MKDPRTSLRLRVVPGAKRPGIVGRHGDAWKVRVGAPPEQGRANDAVLELLARVLDVERRDLTLARGASSRDKVVMLEGVSDDVVEARLEEAVGARR